MKAFKLSAILVISVFLMAAVPVPALRGKCKGDDEYQKGVKKLGKFKLIKDYRVSLKSGKAKTPPTASFPISLTAGLTYKFYPINNPDNDTKMIMRIYMNSKKEMMIATTYRNDIKKHYPSIEFKCARTGTYYLFISFANAAKGCGVAFFSVSK